MSMLATRPKSTPPVLSLPFDWVPAPTEVLTDNTSWRQYRTEVWHLTHKIMDELRRRGIEPISAYLNDIAAPDMEVAVLIDSREVFRPDFPGIYDFVRDLSLDWQARHKDSYILFHVFGIDATFNELALIADGYQHRMTEVVRGSA